MSKKTVRYDISMASSKREGGGSGEHPRVKALHEQMKSIEENTIPLLDQLVEKTKETSTTTPPIAENVTPETKAWSITIQGESAVGVVPQGADIVSLTTQFARMLRATAHKVTMANVTEGPENHVIELDPVAVTSTPKLPDSKE